MSSDSIPSQQDALIQLMAPDGYYAYLGVEKIPVDATSEDASSSTNPLTSSSSGSSAAAATQFTVDSDAVKKAYRKLSRRHHPDKGGDPNAFRLLNRAQKVLLHPKLRAQYDNLGIDLDEDAPAEDDTTNNSGVENNTNNNNNEAGSGISQGIVSELASLALTGIIQLAIRTMLMGAVSILVVRYRLTLYPALLFLSYATLSVVGKASLRGGSVYETDAVRMIDALSPVLIMVGLWLMSYGRTSERTSEGADGTTIVTHEAQEWSWLFWVGESMVIALFTYNSITSIPWNIITLGALAVGGGLMALWFRGNFFNYLMVVVLEVILAVLVAMAFPIMELLLEAILNEKLKKVGEKVRDHHRQLQSYYENKEGMGKLS